MRKRTTTTMARVTPRGAVCELDRVGVEQDETSEAVGEGRVVFGTSEGTGKCSLPTQGSDCIGRFRVRSDALVLVLWGNTADVAASLVMEQAVSRPDSANFLCFFSVDLLSFLSAVACNSAEGGPVNAHKATCQRPEGYMNRLSTSRIQSNSQ